MIARSEIDAAKERLRIPEIWHLLGLPGTPGKSCRVPYREDRKASGSVRANGQRFHDFATGDDLDAVEFLARVRGITAGQAIKQFVELANGRQIAVEPPPIIRAQPKDKPRAERPNLSRLRKATRSEIEQIADSRKIDPRAVELAQDLGTLKAGEVCGFLSWVILDESGLCAEGRRITRKPYPAIKTEKVQLDERKAHTLGGSQKNWPVGLLPAEEYRKCVEAFALVEGGPDYLAALHFALAQKRTGVLPVALLGRCQGLHGLHPDSLQYLRGMHVRIYPHQDEDNGSYESGLVIAKQLEQIGCEVDFFVFEGLRKTDGSVVKDLNDCVDIAPKHADRLEELFP